MVICVFMNEEHINRFEIFWNVHKKLMELGTVNLKDTD